LTQFISKTLKTLRAKKSAAGPRSDWWVFIWDWPLQFPKRLAKFITGTYHFEPMQMISFKDETVTLWTYADRLFVKTLLFLIKPTFKHIISKRCLHIKGPSGVKTAILWLKNALMTGQFFYFARIDISGYYASIDRNILLGLLRKNFNDPIVLNYLEQIVTIPINQNGAILNPTLGIARRSSLSPFFGALYLSELDRVFENLSGIFWIRYMDDGILLASSKRKFLKAKRQLQQVLAKLKLRCARSKTKMGVLTSGFHFLGIEFKLKDQLRSKADALKMLAPQSQASQTHLQILLHERSCQRAQEKLTFMGAGSESPEKAQRYLSAWSKWWSRTAPPIKRSDCITRWIDRVLCKDPGLAWLGTGLLYLLPSPLLGHVTSRNA